MEGKLKKMKIEAFDSLKYDSRVDEFIVLFNPNTYSQKYEIKYDDAQGQGTTGSAQKFIKIAPQEYSFDFLFDGTGVSSEKREVAEDIETFLNLTAKNQGDIHRPYFLQISWGTLITRCILKTASISYSLFKPDGAPLRAKVTASFSENIEDTLRSAEEGNNSPDLTHHRVVKEGDRLPLMCYKIYKNPGYYLQVAKFNGLRNYRKLKVGSVIQFPPLKQGTTA